MKLTNQYWYSSTVYILLIILSFFFYSCQSYNFSTPQPADKENIYEFPEEYFGKWMETIEPSDISSNNNLPVNNPGKQDSYSSTNNLDTPGDSVEYVIAKKYVLYILHAREKIVKGAWPRLNEKGSKKYLPPNYERLRTILFDSVHKHMDTVDNYLLNGNRIYALSADRLLGKGYSYYTDKDTIIVNKNDTIFIDLGQNAFLRRLKNNFYVLNIRNSILGADASEISHWWQLILFGKKEDKSIELWTCTPKAHDIPCMIHHRDTRYADILYFDCQWTTADMERLVEEGYFEMNSKLHRMVH